MIPCDQAVGIGRRANGVVVSIWDSLHMAPALVQALSFRPRPPA